MPVDKNAAIQPEPGQFSTNAMKYARGRATLVLGAVVDNVPGFSASAALLVSRLNPAGGIGNLSGFYNSVNGNISIASDDPTEASDVYWVLID